MSNQSVRLTLCERRKRFQVATVKPNEDLPELVEAMTDEDLSRRREIFYKLDADTKFQLSDNEVIQVNRAVLCYNANSDVLFQMLYGPLKADDITIIKDIDSLSFRLFLDCLMDLQLYTYEVAFKIFPVAWKYQVQKCIDRCIEALGPFEVDENICNVLNMATMYDCEALLERNLNFIFTEYGSYRFIEKREFILLLEPATLLEILHRIVFKDSYLLSFIVQWGITYLNSSEGYENIQDLFKKTNIETYVAMDLFETAGSLIEFSGSDHGKDVFPINEVVTHLNHSENLLFLKSSWKLMKKGDSITEDIFVKVIFDKNIRRNVSFCYGLETNHLVFYDLPLPAKDEEVITIELGLRGVKNFNSLIVAFKNPGENDPSCYSKLSTKQLFSCRRDLELNPDFFTVRIKYTFLADCRILLTSELKNHCNNSKLYFTQHIPCKEIFCSE